MRGINKIKTCKMNCERKDEEWAMQRILKLKSKIGNNNIMIMITEMKFSNSQGLGDQVKEIVIQNQNGNIIMDNAYDGRTKTIEKMKRFQNKIEIMFNMYRLKGKTIFI